MARAASTSCMMLSPPSHALTQGEGLSQCPVRIQPGGPSCVYQLAYHTGVHCDEALLVVPAGRGRGGVG